MEGLAADIALEQLADDAQTILRLDPETIDAMPNASHLADLYEALGTARGLVDSQLDDAVTDELLDTREWPIQASSGERGLTED